jgi:DNA-directed RNA polymerase subunit RPC12/RpoP
LLEFIVSCETSTWKAGLFFGIVAIIVITGFILTKQHIMVKCPQCSSKISPVKNNVLNMIKSYK